MARRRRRGRMDILDWWQGVLDETKDFVDDTIDRARDDDYEDLEGDIQELREAVTQLNAKLDRLLAAGPSKASDEVVLETPPFTTTESRKEQATS